MDNVELSREDFLEWLELKVTKAYFYEIHQRLKELHLELGSGKTLNKESADQTAIETARVVGSIEELQNMLDIDILKE